MVDWFDGFAGACGLCLGCAAFVILFCGLIALFACVV